MKWHSRRGPTGVSRDVIKAGAAPPPPRAVEAGNAGGRPGPGINPRGQFSLNPSRSGAQPSAPRAFPKPFAGQPQKAAPAPGMGSDAAKMLSLGLTQVMKMPPAQRKLAVKDFATQLDQQFRQMQGLTVPQRSEQMAAMRPVQEGAMRTYKGLTPDQQREFKPIIEVFNRWMR